MTISKDLFDLIHSLSRTEKAYFQKNSAAFIRGGGNKYMLLFDAIEKQKIYNENDLLKKFQREPFVRQFSVAKNYLYNRILDTMQSYHGSVLSEVHGLMNKSEYLFEKGLYRQADKLLRAAEKTARKHELHSTLITINENQRFDQAIKTREPKAAEKNIEEAQSENGLLSNHMEYLKLLAQTQQAYNSYGKTNNKKYLSVLKKIIRNPLLKDESRALTFNSKRRFYDIHAVYSSITGNEEQAYQFSNKIISLFDKEPSKKKYTPILYAGYINNTLLFSHSLRKYKEMEACLGKLAEIKPLLTTKYEQARLFEIYTNNFLSLYCSTGRFREAEKLTRSLLAELREHEKRLADRDKFLLFGNIAYLFFGLGDPRKCLVWLNRIRNELTPNIRPDLDSEIMLLNIIVHYELGHTELVPHLVTSYYRFLRKKKLTSKPEKYLLSFFRKLSNADSEKTITGKMQDLRDQIASYMNEESKNENNTPFFFDIVSWLESKIEKRSFAEIIRKKSEKFL